jgi:hypothetical protein
MIKLNFLSFLTVVFICASFSLSHEFNFSYVCYFQMQYLQFLKIVGQYLDLALRIDEYVAAYKIVRDVMNASGNVRICFRFR